jgi:hypothetical protein
MASKTAITWGNRVHILATLEGGEATTACGSKRPNAGSMLAGEWAKVPTPLRCAKCEAAEAPKPEAANEVKLPSYLREIVEQEEKYAAQLARIEGAARLEGWSK